MPRLTSAHNFRKGLGIYTFIADLQYQDFIPSLNWINSIDNERKFYPRIRYKDLILTRATWKLPAFPNNSHEHSNENWRI
ncbi:lantibiotic dehydratase [Sphingobacterium sp. N143]|uniref:lantibiotic dehydratase n=1 Tax=Sphingobacterium sp. N143 TaxID=2746727 RepID=UPI00336ADB1D